MAGVGWAQEAEVPRKEQAPDPYHQQDFTAYTVEKGQWRLGLGPIDYGLLDNVSVGTTSYLWIVGPNARAKITAIHTERVDVAVQGSVVKVSQIWTEALTNRGDILLRVTPIGWRGSAILSPTWSLHLGNTWTLGRLEGTVSGQDIVDLVGLVAGGNIQSSIGKAVGNDVYAGAWSNFALAQSSFAVDWRRNRRDSWILESNSTLWASGLVVGEVGSGSTDVNGQETEVAGGAAARFRAPLKTVPSAVSISRQWSFEKLNLRVGIPLVPGNPLSWTQALQIYWLL